MKRENEKQETLSVTLPANIIAALDRYVSTQDQGITREDALISALRDWAMQNGLLQSGMNGDEGLRPDQLNATNDD
ncbi:hypothetical protein JF546_08470 [Nitratireductor aquimarinus]|uniref:hypothetical protein n=1 Tax=Nitratireductor TaxID=245876 RepID=UPI001A8EA610|nr:MULTISPECIES: hypothetical protein [Nitratireductor]MBN8243041.1 hypothetical protein [Nitratireductor aquimarinus]MBY6132142.1 hypothetical protein [Nitratireductor aquimarinus]MCA1301678.1 hypothetical protein [Nitratireductor aquimarinus]MCV0350468.1 hypothetical protein [Nitratireductor sp.]